MRRALLLVVLAVAACGDPSPAAAPDPGRAPAPGPASAGEVPFDAVFDDAKLDELVFDTARTGKLDALSSLTLPPRCDRVRAAVHVLHEHLLVARKPPPDRAQLLAALGALANAEGGGTAKSLGPLVAAWRAWTDEQAAAEAAIAGRAAASFEVLGRRNADAAALAAAMHGSQSPPPKSPAEAQIAFLRAALLVLAAPDDGAVPADVADAYAHAEKLFDDLGWPGGFGSSADALAKRLLAANPKSRIGINLADRAQAAYARSGDEVRASLVFLTLSEAAERRGDLKTAEYLADGGRERLLAAGGSGRELYDVTLRHGSLAQRLGRQTVAARDLGRAWDAARTVRLGARECVDVAGTLATSLYYLGRFAEARDVCVAAMNIHDDAVVAGGKPVEPARTTLAEIAAQATLDLGHADEAMRLYRDAASRHAAAAVSDPSMWSRHDTDALLAAQAQLRTGDADGAVQAIDGVTSRSGVDAPARAHAASILREAKRFDEAEMQLSRAETDGGARFKDALVEERARLAQARGDTAAARALFAQAIARVKTSDDKPVGWEAARVLRDWARMELDLGRLYEASELAGRAVVELRDAGLDVELDRARKLYVDIERRRLWFGEAAKAADQRLAALPPGDDARRDDAMLDVFLIQMELALQEPKFQSQKDAEKNLLAAVATFPEGWRRQLATQATLVITNMVESAVEHVAVPADAPPRWKLLSEVTWGKGDDLELAKRCGADEPELRRCVESSVNATGDRIDAMELRRRPDPIESARALAALGPDEAVLYVEPMSDTAKTYVLRAGGTASSLGVGFGAGTALADFWDAVFVDPSPEHLTSAAIRVSHAIFTDEVVKKLDGVKRLYISVSEPLGPLPYDLLPFGDGLLIDKFDVVTVNSLTEFVKAHARREPALLATLVSPCASLDERHALVAFGTVDPKARARLFELIGKFQNEGKDAASALRAAKLALRAEWKPDPKAPPAVPAWAAFLLRGAP